MKFVFHPVSSKDWIKDISLLYDWLMTYSAENLLSYSGLISFVSYQMSRHDHAPNPGLYLENQGCEHRMQNHFHTNDYKHWNQYIRVINTESNTWNWIIFCQEHFVHEHIIQTQTCVENEDNLLIEKWGKMLFKHELCLKKFCAWVFGILERLALFIVSKNIPTTESEMDLGR